MYRELIADALQEETNARPFILHNGSDAIRFLADSMLICSFSIINSPARTASRSMTRCAENARTAHTPVLFITANDKRAEFQRRGLTYIRKPFNLFELLATVEGASKARRERCIVNLAARPATRDNPTISRRIPRSQAQYANACLRQGNLLWHDSCYTMPAVRSVRRCTSHAGHVEGAGVMVGLQHSMEFTQDQRQWISPVLIEANQVLLLSRTEFQAAMRAEIMRNPALELDFDSPNGDETRQCPICGEALHNGWCAMCHNRPQESAGARELRRVSRSVVYRLDPPQ